MASPGLMHDTGCLGLVYWDDPEGWDGEGGGRRVLMRNTCTLMEDSSQSMAKPIQYCKVKLINKTEIKKQKQKSKIMGSGSITSWQIEGGKSESSHRFYFLMLQNYCGW